MADENETTEEEAAPKKGKMMFLVLWAGVAVAAIGGGFATPFVVQKFSDSEPEEAVPDDPNGPTTLVEFGEVTVNLNETRLNRYLRVQLSLLIDKSVEADFTIALEEDSAVLKSWLLSYLAQKSMADIRGAAGQNHLRREIRSYFNSVMYPDSPPRIRKVLFQEFNVQ